MTDKTTIALKLAEEALYAELESDTCEEFAEAAEKCHKALAAIREALAEQEKQEPVAWAHTFGGDVQINNLPAECYGDNWTRTPLYAAPVSAPKQEPVAWINEDELPEHYPYEEMFNVSTIINGVRMFPNVKMSDRSMFYGLTKDHTWLSVTESQFNKLKPEKRMKCYLTPVDAKAIRAEALEEAAKVCDAYHVASEYPGYIDCVAAIRGLK